MGDFAMVGYGIAALLFAGFALLLLFNRTEKKRVRALLAAALVTTLWSGVNAYQAAMHQIPAGWTMDGPWKHPHGTTSSLR